MSLKLPFQAQVEQIGQAGDLEKSGKILLLMAQMGMAREALTTMLDFATDSTLKKEHRQFLLAPIVQQKSQWQETER